MKAATGSNPAARIRADAVTFVSNGLKTGKEETPTLMVQIGPNLSVAVVDDTIDDFWNKLGQAIGGRKPMVISKPDPSQPD